ncbi:MAG: GAF domain-containing protein [Anaerolineae bacterium]|nr:GAF domain-containing protein [Anaerolineae bacterium]
MLQKFLDRLFERFGLHSLREKLLYPLATLMIISLLISTIAFSIGTAITQNGLLEQQLIKDSDRIINTLDDRILSLKGAAVALTKDPEIIDSIQQNNENTLEILNSKAVLVRDRFGMDLIQIFNAEGEAKANLVTESLYKETSLFLLDYTDTGEPIVKVVQGETLLLSRAVISDNLGTVIVGIDLEKELTRLATQYRLGSELGLSIEIDGQNRQIGTTDDIPFGAKAGNKNGFYSRLVEVPLGIITADLIAVRATDDIEKITGTGLWVMTGSTVVTTLLLLMLSVGIIRAISNPVQQLSQVANAVARGDLSQRIDIEALASSPEVDAGDEIGILAKSFNSMVSELQMLYGNLEAKVAARTQELSTAAQVANAVSSSLDIDNILKTAAKLIQTRLGFQHVAIFTLNPETDMAILKQTAGEIQGLGANYYPPETPIQLENLIGAAALMHSPSLVQDIETDTQYPQSAWLPGTQAAAAIPLLAGGTVIGVLELQSQVTHAFHPELVSLLRTLADQIAVGMQNAQLYQSEQRRRRFAEVLELTGRVISGSLDMKEVPGRVLSMLKALVDYERGSLWMKIDDKIYTLAHQGYPEEYPLETISIPIQNGDVFDRLMKEHKPVIIDDITTESSWHQLPWLPLDHSWLGTPIISKGNVIGMISLTRRETYAFTNEDATSVQALALQAGVALENANLYAEIAHFNTQLEQRVAERTEELNQAYQTLAQLDKTKANFINVAAHELRTPLTVIIAYGQLLRKVIDIEAKPMAQQSIDGLLAGSKRLHEIINSMLDVAKIDSQMVKINRAPVSIGEVMECIKVNFEQALEERNLTLTFQNTDTLPEIMADKDLIHKAFYHLIINAIKYTPDGGKITVSGSRDTDDDALEEYIQIVIQDTGIGIDPQHQNLIFEKFYQTGEVAVHSSGRTKFKGGGPGLGLAIVRGVILAHGGRIWVESDGYDEENCPGTTFYILLPVVKFEYDNVSEKMEINQKVLNSLS